MEPKVYLCRGSKCGKRQKKLAALARAVAEHATVVPVPCQDICKGPIAGVEVKGRVEWFRRLDTRKKRRWLVELLADGTLGKGLRRRRVKKRSGKLETDDSSLSF